MKNKIKNYDKKTELISNSIIFGIGTIGTKVIQMLLIPLFSYMLSPEQYGEIDLIINTSQLIMPIISLGIIEAIFRFGMDSAEDKESVYSNSLIVMFIGSMLLLSMNYILGLDKYQNSYIICIYAIITLFYSAHLQFIRALEKIKIYVLTSFSVTLLMLIINIIFVVKFKWGVWGYISASILANILGLINLYFWGNIHKYFSFKKLKFKNTCSMLRYSIPTIANTISWWITNVSDRYIITLMLGVVQNGLYSMACKLPSIMSVFTGVFSQAWQISAVKEYEKDELEDFYSSIFNNYAFTLIIFSTIIITVIKPATQIILADQYKGIWEYVPLLVISSSFSAISSFVGAIYTARKKNLMASISTIIGAILNIIFNLLLIPIMGINGACASTLISYIWVVIFRIRDTNKYIKLKLNYKKYTYTILLLIIQSVILIGKVKFSGLINIGICIFILIDNSDIVIGMLKKIYKKIA